jgi:hypothetical protein
VNDLEALARLIRAVEPWRSHLVVVGGWAHRLYRYHPLASVPDYDPLLTRDTDLAYAIDAPLEGDIRGALKQQGFTEEFSGDDNPPVTHYSLGEDDAGFYAEFLTPLRGSGVKREGTPDITESRAGITAQKLRYLELLLIDPWIVTLGGDDGVPLDKKVDVQIANPVTFIAQKLLVQANRHSSKRAQDVLYLHDTIELFGGKLDEFNTVWKDTQASLSKRTPGKVVELANTLFSKVTDPIRSAALIPGDRRLDPEKVRAVCEVGLARIFAED